MAFQLSAVGLPELIRANGFVAKVVGNRLNDIGRTGDQVVRLEVVIAVRRAIRQLGGPLIFLIL